MLRRNFAMFCLKGKSQEWEECDDGAAIIRGWWSIAWRLENWLEARMRTGKRQHQDLGNEPVGVVYFWFDLLMRSRFPFAPI